MQKPNLLPYYQVKVTLLKCKLHFLENPPQTEDEQYAYDVIQKSTRRRYKCLILIKTKSCWRIIIDGSTACINDNERRCNMGTKYVYITSNEWFENSPLKNPICLLDHNLEHTYPDFYKTNYDLKILTTKAPTEEEKSIPSYNDYREKYGSLDVSVIDAAVNASPVKNIFLNGFDQERFEYIAPLIKETAEVLYLFKCTKISNLSILSEFNKLKALFIFANNDLKALWDMRHNYDLKIISLVYITKLQNIESLIESNIEYINFDSSDNYGNKKEMLFDEITFTKMQKLKHLFLTYRGQ